MSCLRATSACSDGENADASSASPSTAAASGSSAGGTGGTGSGSAGADAITSSSAASTGGSGNPSYDALVLSDGPVAYWAMEQGAASEPDLTGNRHTGAYQGAPPRLVGMPNGDVAADFDGATGYVTVPSSASFSIPTTGSLTWEAWIRPDVLQFPNDDGSSGYVAWMGKCEQYAPTCEWEARMYDTNTSESPNRPNRLSAYVFNPRAGLGSGADWQPAPSVIEAGAWYHVVAEYTIQTQPDDCNDVASYPGSIDIWVNGVEWDHASHGQTGCMSQYAVVPEAADSALNIGTMATDSWFEGAIGKVAIYDHLLGQASITAHYVAMTGEEPTGSCADTCTF